MRSKEENRQRAREWYYANRERAKKRIHKWQKENPEKVKATRLKNIKTTRAGQKKCYVRRRSHYISKANEWSKNNRIARRKISTRWARNSSLKKLGLSESDVLSMKNKQNWVCLICNRKKKLNVDHCHKTGKVRGLLCHLCNIGLGVFKDSPANLRNAAKYLEGSI